jgi:hypothetical protein
MGMQQTNPKAQQRGKKNVLVAGLGAAFVATGITFAVLSGNPATAPSPPQVQAAAQLQTAPAPTTPAAEAAAPQTKSCQIEPRVEFASVENGGSGVVRFRAGDYLSPPITLTTEPQPIVFPKPRPEGAPLEESIIVEGQATNLVLGAEGDHFVIPRVDGSSTYWVTWSPAKACDGQ